MAIELEVFENCVDFYPAEDSTTFDLRDRIEIIASSDYNDLDNKPALNGRELIGDQDIKLVYDPTTSVGFAKTDSAETGLPNYTPVGTIQTTSRAIDVPYRAAFNITYTSTRVSIAREVILFTRKETVMSSVDGFTGTGVNFSIEIGGNA